MVAPGADPIKEADTLSYRSICLAKLSEILIPITVHGTSLAPPPVAEFGNVTHGHEVIPEPCRPPGCLVPRPRSGTTALQDQGRIHGWRFVG